MSEADEMFEKLGYVKSRDENFIYYHHLASDNVIEFNEVKKVISSHDYEEEVLGHGIELEELKAINKKCEELGWF